MVSVIILKFEIITKKKIHTHIHGEINAIRNVVDQITQKQGNKKKHKFDLKVMVPHWGVVGVCAARLWLQAKKAVTMRSKGLTGFVFFKHIKQMLAFAVTWSKKLRKPSIINSITNSVPVTAMCSVVFLVIPHVAFDTCSVSEDQERVRVLQPAGGEDKNQLL